MITCCEAKGPLLSSDLFECSPIQCQVITVILPITTIAVFYLRNVLICDGMGWKEGDQEYIHHLSKHEIFLQNIFCKKCLLKIPKICKSLILFIFFFGCRDIPCLLKWGTYSCSPCGENHCHHIVCMTIIIYMKFKLSTKKWKLLSKFEKKFWTIQVFIYNTWVDWFTCITMDWTLFWFWVVGDAAAGI